MRLRPRCFIEPSSPLRPDKVRNHGRSRRVETDHVHHAAVVRVCEGEAVGGHTHNDRLRVTDELAAILTQRLYWVDVGVDNELWVSWCFLWLWFIWRKASVMLRPRRCRSCFRDKCSQLISACLPKLAARVGLAPTPCGLTNRRATLTPPGNGAAGRILTCIVPFRRRMPHIFDHGSNLKLVSAAGVAPAIPRSQAECVGCYATR